MFFINNLPFLLFSFLFSNIFYISFISIFSWIDFSRYFYILQILFFLISIFLLKKYKKNFQAKKQKFFYLLIPYLIIIFLRWPMYTKVHDDLTYYLVVGEYTKNLWNNPHFFPTYAIYFYNALPLFYNFFVSIIGLRLTLFISMIILSFWMVSLSLRFNQLLKTNFQKLILDFFFISFPFWPHLMVIHGTFMADFFSLVFILEAFYQFINKEKDKTFAFIAFIVAGLVKQSSVFYVIPIFIYLLIKNIKNIDWKKIIIFLLIFITPFFYRLYKEISNPLPVCFFNFIFKSPLCSEEINFSIGLPFGGKSLLEKIFWPMIAQFMPGFAEGFVSKYAKIYFTPFLALPYLISFLLIFLKRKFIYVLLFLSFIFWSFHIGYARWVIPLIGISWMWLIIENKINLKFKIGKFKTAFLYLFILCLSLSSIKSDFGWRPYHYLPFLKQLYIEGWKLVLKDRYSDIKKEFKNEFNNFDTIAMTRGEKTYFYGFMGSLYGKKLIEAHNLNDYEKFLSSHKIGKKLKENLKNLISQNKVLLIVDTMYAPEEYIKDNYFYKNYKCQRLGNFRNIPQIQFSTFSSIVKYSCKK